MIVGPGNLFVTLAKRHVFGQVAIDMLAGPSEIVIVADESAPASYVAADLIAQAEHSPGASILLTWHAPLIEETAVELESQLSDLARGELARDSLERFGALVLTRSQDEALDCANQIAPEHLHLATRYPEPLVDRVTNAGAIFVGHHTPVAIGDYVAGPSHVLPTGGPAGLKRVADDVRLLADKEGLTAHAASITVRLQNRGAAVDELPQDRGLPAYR
jgi:histidinol dehydrogenase